MRRVETVRLMFAVGEVVQTPKDFAAHTRGLARYLHAGAHFDVHIFGFDVADFVTLTCGKFKGFSLMV